MAGERTKEMWRVYRKEYRDATRREKGRILDEVCRVTGYHRKYAVHLLRLREEPKPRAARRRGVTYPDRAVAVWRRVWEAAGYPSGERLKAMADHWLPWARRHVADWSPELEQAVRAISARQLDRRLARDKRAVRRRLYGRTKPGALLKHQIPIRTDSWNLQEPGFLEVDTVAHGGDSATGEFIYSVNLTDLFSGWTEPRAVMGRGEAAVVQALDAVAQGLPFPVQGIDSDNGSEFINYHLFRYCAARRIALTRTRPYHKNDNAHIEQKNWTQVRKVFGWDRYDRPELVEAMNDLYANEWRWMTNLFQPSARLVSKERVGARVRRRYDAPQTPLDRLVAYYTRAGRRLPLKLKALLALRERLDPFALAEAIERKLAEIIALRKQQSHHTPVLVQQHGSPRGAHTEEPQYATPRR